MAGWLILTSCSGKEIETPSREDLSNAIEELRQNDSAESPAVWLKSGTDGGAVYLLDVAKDGTVSISKFVSEEADDPIVELVKTVSLEKALELLTWLAEDKAEQIEEELAGDQLDRLD